MCLNCWTLPLYRASVSDRTRAAWLTADWLTLGGASAGSQKTSSKAASGQNGDRGGVRAMLDMELLWGASRLERRVAVWVREKIVLAVGSLSTIFSFFSLPIIMIDHL